MPKFRVRDRDRLLLDLDFGELPGRYPFTLMLPQEQTEAILRARLREVGVEVQWATELDTVAQQGDRLVAHFKSAAGNIDMHVSWVVGCDGLHSKVREEAEIPFVGGTYRQEFVLADVDMDWPLACSEVDLFFAPRGLMVVAPLPHDRYRIVATASKPPEQPDVSFIQRLLENAVHPVSLAASTMSYGAHVSMFITGWQPTSFPAPSSCAATPRMFIVLLAARA